MDQPFGRGVFRMKVSPATGSQGAAPRGAVSGLNATVLVLNKLYHPIHVTSARRAFVLLYKNDAEAISLADERLVGFDFSAWLDFSHKGPPATDDDDFVATVSARLRVPRIGRLLDYERFPIGRV